MNTKETSNIVKDIMEEFINLIYQIEFSIYGFSDLAVGNNVVDKKNTLAYLN